MSTTSAVNTAVPTPARRSALGWGIHDAIVVSRRNLIQTLRNPELLFFSLVQPVIFVLLFAYVFGGAIPVPGASPEDGAAAYREYLMPGIFGQTVAFAAASSTVGIAEDMSKGIIDRFRSLPMRSSAVLFGRTTADAVRLILVLARTRLRRMKQTRQARRARRTRRTPDATARGRARPRPRSR